MRVARPGYGIKNLSKRTGILKLNKFSLDVNLKTKELRMESVEESSNSKVCPINQW